MQPLLSLCGHRLRCYTSIRAPSLRAGLGCKDVGLDLLGSSKGIAAVSHRRQRIACQPQPGSLHSHTSRREMKNGGRLPASWERSLGNARGWEGGRLRAAHAGDTARSPINALFQQAQCCAKGGPAHAETWQPTACAMGAEHRRPQSPQLSPAATSKCALQGAAAQPVHRPQGTPGCRRPAGCARAGGEGVQLQVAPLTRPTQQVCSPAGGGRCGEGGGAEVQMHMGVSRDDTGTSKFKQKFTHPSLCRP
jgi:hypothetical protein